MQQLVQHGHLGTLAVFGCVYFCGLAAVRYMAIHTVDMLVETIYLAVPSPLEASMLAIIALCGTVYGLDKLFGYSSPTTRLSSSLQLSLKSRRSLSLTATPRSNPNSEASTPRSTSSIASSMASTMGSPFKDISSHRLPANSFKRRAKTAPKQQLQPQQQLHSPFSNHQPSRSTGLRRGLSLEVYGSPSQVELTLKPRTAASLDTLETPALASPMYYNQRRRSSSASRRAAASMHRKSSQRRSSMPRISSGRELPSLDLSQHKSQQHLEEINNHSGLHSLMEPRTPPNEPASPCISTASTSSSPASLAGSWASSTFSWAAERADSLLRPAKALVVPQMNAAAFGYGQILSPREGDTTTSNGRTSLDNGPTARHYTHGGMTAAPERRAALEQYACAARLQARSGVATGVPAHPGRVAMAGDVGSSALASLGLDGDCALGIREHVTDEHLLQFGSLIGETASSQVADKLGLPAPHGMATSLFGPYDVDNDPDQQLDKWEQIMDQSSEGLHVRSHRLYLREGLYLYKTSVVVDGATPRDIRPFHVDDAARALWDEGALFVSRALPYGATRVSRHSESCLHKYTSKFPRPMAAREYNYARRVWHRPSDGGCYVLCRSMELPHDVNAPKAVPVKDYTSGCVIRSVQGGTEVLTCYFEDSQLRPSLVKMGVPKALWPFWSKYTDALRMFMNARKTAATFPHHHHHHHHGRRSLEIDPSNPLPTPSQMLASSSHRLNNVDIDSQSDSGSEDEVYEMLEELRYLRRGTGAGGRSARWARRLLIMGAFKIAQVALSAA